MTGHWALEDVTDMGSRLVVSGTDNHIFKTNADITRAEFAAIVVRGLGLMHSKTGQVIFKDIHQTDWFYDAIRIAYDYGIIKGFDDGSFKPNNKISRQEAMVMIARAMEVTKKLNTTIAAKDMPPILLLSEHLRIQKPLKYLQ